LTGSLQEIPKEKWKDELAKEGKLVKLLVTLIQKGVPVKLSGEFHDALLEHAKLVLEEEAYPEEFLDQWNKVFEALEEDYQTTFLRCLRDGLIKQPNKDGGSLLKLYGSQLLRKLEILEEKSDDVVRLWFKGILNRQNPEELSWLKQALNKARIYQNCPNETQKVFREEIGFKLEPSPNAESENHSKDNDGAE